MKAPTDAEFLKIRALEQNGATRDAAWKIVLGYTAKELNGGGKKETAPKKAPAKAASAKKTPAKKAATTPDPLL